MSDNGNNEIWASDPILAEILQPIFENGSPFQCLPKRVKRKHTDNEESLKEAFKKLFHCQEAEQAYGVVFIWVLDQPYEHQEGSYEPSTIVRIEETKNSIKDRWSSQHIKALVTDWHDKATLDNPDNMRVLATRDCNWSFFSEIISNFGPLRIWWSDVEHLNEASVKYSLETPQKWEKFICEKYRERYGCLPLKDERCG